HGDKPALGLKKACEDERRALAAKIPGLKWRVRLEQAVARAVEAQGQLDKAESASSVDKQVELLGASLGGFKECVERAEALPKEPGADKKLSVTSALGSLSASGLAKLCKGRVPQADKALAKAYDAQKLEAFIKTCQGDEGEVARREGMPTRVESLKNGRV